MTFDEARLLFPVLDRIAYLNAGTFGPLARPVADAMRAALDRDLREGRSGRPVFEAVVAERALLRQELADLVRAEPDQVALTSSTTEGCNIVLAGLDLDAGDEVVTTTDEHFGLLGALGASRAHVVVVDPDPDAILAAVTTRTRLIAVSQVLWTTGAELPVAELRSTSGVPVLVDAAQSVGAMPVSSAGVDFLTISGQKWLTGPDGTGALVVADPERLRVAAPSYFSQRSYEPNGSFEPREGAARFERGWWSAAAVAGLRAALAVQPQWWYERAVAATTYCRQRLGEQVEVVSPATPATLVAFRPDGDSAANVVERLRLVGVHVREIPGRGIVRASVGWWTSDDDVDRLVAGL